MRKRIGIITALPREGQTLPSVAGTSISDQVLVSVGGLGQRNAARAAQSLLDQSVDALISWGMAGGLNPALNAGSLVLGISVHSDQGYCYQCDDQWIARLSSRLENLGVIGGRVYSPDVAASTGAEKTSTHNDHGFDIVDMESSAIAETAVRMNVPFVVVRCVVDPANFDVPESALQAVANKFKPQLIPLLKMLMRKPYELGALLRLAGQYRAALDKLTRAGRQLGPDFAI